MRSYTNIESMTGDFDVSNGMARTSNLKAALDVGTMAATGSVNLADQTLNLRVVAVLNKQFSDEVGGMGVGGYLSTVLANSKGELVVPVVITGSLEKPRVAPDVARIAQMKLENLAPTLANPGELTSILGTILGGKKKTEGGEQPAEKQPGLGDILDTLGGKKKTESAQPAGGAQPQPGAPTAPAQPSQQPQPQQKPVNPLEQILDQVLKPKQKKPPAQQQPPPQQQQQQQEEEKPPDQPK